ncbi:hypothetical protein IWW57_000768, partial [Coemansia sp. S610]
RRRRVKRAKRNGKCAVGDSDLMAGVKEAAPLDSMEPEDDASAASVSGADDESDEVVGQGRVMRLHRQVVIRNAFLSQGLSEAESISYSKRWTKQTNNTYDKAWSKWVNWCDSRELDPTRRSDEDLAKFITELNTSSSSGTRLRVVVKSVWSIVDGTVHLKSA